MPDQDKPLYVYAHEAAAKDHFDYCFDHRLPYVEIHLEGDAQTGPFACISYEITGGDTLCNEIDDDLPVMLEDYYKAYCEFYGIAVGQQMTSAKNQEHIYRVDRKHAPAIAEQLFHYLKKYLRQFRTSRSAVYDQAMLELGFGPDGLRCIFDMGSEAFASMGDLERLEMLSALVRSGFSFPAVIKAYKARLEGDKESANESLKRGLVYNALMPLRMKDIKDLDEEEARLASRSISELVNDLNFHLIMEKL